MNNKKSIEKLLEGSTLTLNLNPKETTELFALLESNKIIRHDKGQFFQTRDFQNLYYVTEGLYLEEQSTDRFTGLIYVDLVTKDNLLGDTFMPGNKKTWFAKEDSSIIKIPQGLIYKIQEDIPNTIPNVDKLKNRTIRRYRDIVTIQSVSKLLNERVYRALLFVSEHIGGKEDSFKDYIWIKGMSFSDIAQLASTSRESISRLIKIEHLEDKIMKGTKWEIFLKESFIKYLRNKYNQ